MRLETIAVAVRPRSGFEAIDLGLRMAASWWRPVFAVWCVVALPIALALHGAFWADPIVASLVFWWLKPVFERFVLHVVSRCVFGTPPRLVETLRDWRAILGSGLIAALTWRRLLDLARSFTLPVVQLEGQSGRAAAARRRLLGQRLRGAAIWLTIACAGFVAILVLACDFTVAQLLPVGDDLADSAPPNPLVPAAAWWDHGDALFYVLAETLIEPFYVAGGFALYLSRRVMLEGWDVELALRRMAARLSARSGARRAAAALLFCAALGAVAPARAADCAPAVTVAVEATGDDASSGGGDDEETTSDDDEEDDDEAPAKKSEGASSTESCKPAPAPHVPLDTPARRAVVDVMKDPQFGAYEEVERWKYRFEKDPDADPKKAPGWWKKVSRLFGQIAQVLAWIVIGGVIIALIVWAARRYGSARDAPVAPAAPAVLFGLKIAPDTLPDDIAAAAAALIEQGQFRAALSLIYRGALSVLVHRRGLRVLAGDTEGDVLAAAGAMLEKSAREYFARLVAQWIDVAYARHAPDADAIRALCAAYDAHFGARDAAPPPAGAVAGAPA